MLFSRKQDKENEENSESDGPMLQQALPVNTELEIDESRPASTAEEYLLRVRLQRKKMPKVSYAKHINSAIGNDQNKKKKVKKSKYFNDYNKYFEQSTIKQHSNPLLLPNAEWKQKFIKSFKLKRNWLLQHNVKQSQQGYIQALKVPNYLNSDQWLKFALNYNNKDNQCKDDNEKYPIPPFLAVIEQLKPIETEKLLQLFMKFVMDTHENNNGDYGLNGLSALWIYSLFIRIDLPLRADLTANIRDFARFCIEQRNKLKHNESSSLIVYVNMFIVIIEDVFNQPIT